MSFKPLVIVESPTKARTIAKFLGSEFRVEASNGHVRDLPSRGADLTPKHKEEGWTSLGVKIDKSFEPLYVIPSSKTAQVKKLKDALKGASELYLATDEDREGESISWHILEILKPKVPVKRLVFHEITKSAIRHSIENARQLDKDLVRAQETRRIIDRLYGYLVSDILWRKMAQGLSAGRVQSIVVRILVEREKERIAFKSANFFGLLGEFSKKSGEGFSADLTHITGQRIATSRDFDPLTGSLLNANKAIWLDKAKVEALVANANDQAKVVSVEEKPYESKPSAPFTTSSLQQEANRKLRFSASRTMSLAQQLYENGFITYMRTDSTTLSEQAIQAARSLIERDYGSQYLTTTPRIYKTSVKNAQEAHEAIRPAGDVFTSPDSVDSQLGRDAARLYDLIWKRTVASQMSNARGTRITVGIECGELLLRASGKTIEFPGFLRAYVEGSDNPDADLADQEKILPKLQEGELLSILSFKPVEKDTQPPSHYSEGSLIKELESRGIGRPSTWATVVETVVNRSYAFRRGNQLLPTFTALGVYNLMNLHFEKLINYEFTAHLEDGLDSVSRGERTSLEYLRDFYFGSSDTEVNPGSSGSLGLEYMLRHGKEEIDPRTVCSVAKYKTDEGSEFEVRIGKSGPFITNGKLYSSVPEGISPEELNAQKCSELIQTAEDGQMPLGYDPISGGAVFLKTGRFGPYVQLLSPEVQEVDSANSETKSETEKEVKKGRKKSKTSKVTSAKALKTASLLAGMDPKCITLDIAVQLLSLPRELGKHPETGDTIIAANGRFGHYVKCGQITRTIPSGEFSPLTITYDAAMDLLNTEPKTRGRTRVNKDSNSKLKSAEGTEIGVDPVTGKSIQIKIGRYGPYITDGDVNASYRAGTENLPSLAEAIDILSAKKLSSPEPSPKTKRASKSNHKKISKT